ncbi:GNAT family N-acetyltransferase [Gordonia sputi]|uniref:Putative acetyltransferase n=1 Tax=Gordonia sputi NBRC 100414 TaxID=1089453 RepID=H5TV00_9ACTN|nr:GNAT family N-acetyltransferase [Gordonia sputi]GAB37308.1 putative acetyltransferase [Gordonia sputi NBRC 100414]
MNIDYRPGSFTVVDSSGREAAFDGDQYKWEITDGMLIVNAITTEGHFAAYIASDESDVLIARTSDGTTVGYSLVHHRPSTDPDVAAVVVETPSSELSKMYVLPDHHSRGRTEPPAQLLMRAAIETARDRGSVLVWLGVNQENVRAQRFYTKMGFERAGVKTFDLNGSIEHDFILTRRL